MKKLITLALVLTAILQACAGEIKITANLTGFSDNAVVYLLNEQTPLAYQTLSQGTVELKAEVAETPQSYMLYIVENNQPYYTALFVADETIEITASKEDFPYQVKVLVLNTTKSKHFSTRNNCLFTKKAKHCNKKCLLCNKVASGTNPKYKKNILETTEQEVI